ncbi:MAG: thioredoxin family protein [Bacteroidota bacterium]|nr:thioredoxin family protein [Bacteroidota bacterium]
MTAKFFSMLLSCIIISCSGSGTYKINVEESGTKIVTGRFNSHLLKTDVDLKGWFDYNYKDYAIDRSQLQAIDSLSKDVHYVLIMGTWCSDSKLQVPHLFKIFDSTKVFEQKIEMHGVDRSKKSDDGVTEKYNVQRVPTLIVYKGDQEVGRIVESPRETLEKDLVRILKK